MALIFCYTLTCSKKRTNLMGLYLYFFLLWYFNGLNVEGHHSGTMSQIALQNILIPLDSLSTKSLLSKSIHYFSRRSKKKSTKTQRVDSVAPITMRLQLHVTHYTIVYSHLTKIITTIFASIPHVASNFNFIFIYQ